MISRSNTLKPGDRILLLVDLYDSDGIELLKSAGDTAVVETIYDGEVVINDNIMVFEDEYRMFTESDPKVTKKPRYRKSVIRGRQG
jgi:hypothetical protein